MVKAGVGDILRFLFRKQLAQEAGDRTDGDLLKQFAATREDRPFTVLFERHAPMVMGVCKRILGDFHQAEDSLQATFHILARRAGTVRWRECLGPWLYALARRVALRARAKRLAQEHLERRLANMPPSATIDDAAWNELSSVLDEEIGRLPQKYSAPLILSYLESKSRSRVSKELGWPEGTVARRLERGRQLLRARLVQRGITLSVAALAATLPEKLAAAPVSATLAINTIKAATVVAAGQTSAGGFISATALTLAEDTMRAMLFVKAKLAVVVVAVSVALGGAGWAGYKSYFEPAQIVPSLQGQVRDKAIPATDVLAGYQSNASKFETLRVVWKYAEQKKERWFQLQQWTTDRNLRVLAELNDKKIKETEETEDIIELKEALRNEVERIKLEMNDPLARKKQIFETDFWTDRQSFQIRQKIRRAVGEGQEQVFPDVPLDEKSLTKEYKNISIVSFNGKPEDGVRVWGGMEDGFFVGGMFPNISGHYEGKPFPPIQLEADKWASMAGRDFYHPLDTFFGFPATEMIVEESQVVNGRKLVVLSRTKTSDNAEEFLHQFAAGYQGRVQLIRKHIAWLDPSQGFLPLRIEFHDFVLFKDGDKSYKSVAGPVEVIEVTKVAKIPGGGFYPMKGTVSRFDYLTKEYHDDKDVVTEDFLRGRYSLAKGEVVEEFEWEVNKIEAGWKVPETMFDLPFPEGTKIFDRRKEN